MLFILLYFVGVYVMSVSISFIIIHLNLFNIGYNFIDYVNFIIRRGEVLLFIPGLIITMLSIYRLKGKR